MKYQIKIIIYKYMYWVLDTMYSKKNTRYLTDFLDTGESSHALNQ